MTSLWLLLTLTVCTSCLPLASLTSVHQIDAYRLYEDLFDFEYRKQVRPVSEYDGPLVVYVKYSLISMIELDEKSQTMETASKLELDWTDSFLQWDEVHYSHIQNTTVPQENIWLPDVVVDNSVEKHEQLGYKQLPVRVYSDGQVIWTPSVITKTQCDIIVTYYPFDTQKCDIEIATEVSFSHEIYLYIWTKNPVVVDEYSEDGSWKLISSTARNIGSDEFEDKKSKIIFTILLERRNTFYVVSIIAPVLLLSLTASLVFALPAESGEKMSTAITVLLAFAVYLTIISDYLPDTSLQTSILAIYLTLLLGVSAFSVLITTFVLRLHHAEGPVGPRTRGLVRFIRALTCRSGNQSTPRREEPETPRPDYEKKLSRSRERSAPYQIYNNGITVPKHFPAMNHLSKSRENLQTLSMTTSSGSDCPTPRKGADQEGDDMTWRKVAQTIDWFLFIFFTTTTIIITAVCVATMVIGGARNKPTLDAMVTNHSDYSDYSDGGTDGVGDDYNTSHDTSLDNY